MIRHCESAASHRRCPRWRGRGFGPRPCTPRRSWLCLGQSLRASCEYSWGPFLITVRLGFLDALRDPLGHRVFLRLPTPGRFQDRTMPVRVIRDLRGVLGLEHVFERRKPRLTSRTSARHAHLAPANALPRGTPCSDTFEVCTNSAG